MPDLIEADGAPTARHRPRAAAALAALPVAAPVSEVWAALGAAGVLTDLYDHEDPDPGPGTGTAATLDPARLADLIRAVDARGDNGVTLSVLVQAASALPLLAACAPATGPVRQALEEALSGSATVALAATDSAAAGSDLAGLGTEVDIAPDGLLLTGGKRWITTACAADRLLVLARHRPGRHFTSFTWVLVPATAPGVRVRPADSDLLGGSATGHVELDGVRLPPDHLVGRPGRGMAVFARHMGTERLAGALWAVALTSRVLADTRERLTRRHCDGRPLWHHDAVRQRYAACLVQVRQLRALCESLAERVTRRQDLAAAALLKSAAGLVADPVLAACAQLQGADGFARDGAQTIRGEAGVLGIGGGVTEVVLAAVADHADTLLTELRS
ncbi:acyl-CoA dehydrogenase family protein [Streptomyces sp. ID05-04B]|uniref:acyl-CoA dehydrogenase family protein n=1 Tax=Streptomyces sp. ID05-04B TaxID=3028661 RepID=UPI0029C377EF|nr:acyl-CoA dehydrogenase family protein [Streptomyces sp. ID05-04B]MDX5569331.1 acyl-CoA dehydrogenase family protein [Streptomyces sp. ID05-04B]